MIAFCIPCVGWFLKEKLFYNSFLPVKTIFSLSFMTKSEEEMMKKSTCKKMVEFKTFGNDNRETTFYLGS